MAVSIGSGVSSQATMRPVLVRLMRPASDSTSRCFMTAGSDIGNGRASSLTEALSPLFNRASNARLVGSARAANVRSSMASLYLTIKLSIKSSHTACQATGPQDFSMSATSLTGFAGAAICSKVHWRGALSGRQRTSLVPWRKPFAVTWS